jgi:hypothetical protein
VIVADTATVRDGLRSRRILSSASRWLLDELLTRQANWFSQQE